MTLPSDLVASMYADYQRGLSLSAVSRRYKRCRKSLREVFARRGLKLRDSFNQVRGSSGQFVPFTAATPAEINAMIAGLTRIAVPPALKTEWRHWSLARRGKFIARLRRKLKSPQDRPATPFSSNVEPFDYATPRAWAIARKANAGCNSRTARVKLKPASQGVIWHKQLFFWSAKSGAYYAGPFLPGIGRPALHHLIWQQHNRKPLPASHTVIFKDGNKNNLSPRNLALRSRADCAIQNRSRSRVRYAREMTALLLNKHQRNQHEHIKTLNAIDRH
jgi:hypothetical protein